MLLRMLRVVIAIDSILFLGVTLVCFLAGWRTWQQFGDTLVKAGLLSLVLILVTGLTGNALRADPSGPDREDPFAARLVFERRERSLYFMAGFIAILIAIVVGSALMGAG